jgi:UDP:flavonoid glycosyltransferase YjiC (YdhE family)
MTDAARRNVENVPTAKRRPRILFFAEAVSLAHVARPHVLAQSLSPDEYEVLFACDPRYDSLFADARYQRRRIATIPGDRFLAQLEKGAPLYDVATLESYVAEDLAVIDEFQPDVIVGDFRLSLSVSSRLRRIPYIAISNAYWNPEAQINCPVPELPLTRWFGYGLGGKLFRLGRSIGFAIHARAHNQLRRKHGLPSFPADMRYVYVDGDAVLYADVPELVPLRSHSENHHFVGPIAWSPVATLPQWWDDLARAPRPIIYLTLGSSGDSRALPVLVEGLAGLGGTVLVATAGRTALTRQLKNVYAENFLPGADAAGVADLVVCNGGSPTTYQALAAGKPVLGVPSNLDQCLNIAALKTAGVGEILRVGALSPTAVQKVANSTLTDLDTDRLESLSREILLMDASIYLKGLLFGFVSR